MNLTEKDLSPVERYLLRAVRAWAGGEVTITGMTERYFLGYSKGRLVRHIDARIPVIPDNAPEGTGGFRWEHSSDGAILQIETMSRRTRLVFTFTVEPTPQEESQ